MSRLDPSGTVQSDAELLPRNRKVVGSNPTSDSTSPQLSAHLSGHEQIQDTSRQGRSHNHRYATLAAELGLDVARDPRIGWSLTTLPQPTALLYAAVLAELRAALVLWRYLDTLAGPTATSRNMLACLCPCERRIRVAARRWPRRQSSAAPAKASSNPLTRNRVLRKAGRLTRQSAR
jgi:hypothetical protein